MAQARFGSNTGTPSGTVIGSGLVIEGELSGSDAVTVEGEVRGTVNLSAALTVAEGATVEADVTTTALDVAGSVVGNVAASDRVALQESGRLIGDVRSPRISIAEGATFKGHIDMDA